MRSWNIDKPKLRQVGKALGIKLPVRVTLRQLPENHGGYQTTRDGRHEIYLNTRSARARANASLLHELVHCVQRERLGEAAVPAYTMAHQIFGYDDNPLEVEADRVAEALAPIVQVVR